jgi:hypothetical protein
MFTRWKDHERGPHWQTELIAAPGHVYIYVDQALNIVVVGLLRGTGISNWRETLRPSYAILFQDTPLETRLDPSPNRLVVIEPNGATREFAVADGVARRVWGDTAHLVRADALERLRVLYAGPQRAEIDEYLDQLRD